MYIVFSSAYSQYNASEAPVWFSERDIPLSLRTIVARIPLLVLIGRGLDFDSRAERVVGCVVWTNKLCTIVHWCGINRDDEHGNYYSQ